VQEKCQKLSSSRGGTINESANLSQLFDLSPGNYTVQVSTTTKSITVVVPPAILGPERDHNEVEITKSNVLKLVVIAKPPGG
jgi:hypothetical protein